MSSFSNIHSSMPMLSDHKSRGIRSTDVIVVLVVAVVISVVIAAVVDVFIAAVVNVFVAAVVFRCVLASH